MQVDRQLLDYVASDRQRQAVQSLLDLGSTAKAAKKLGIARSSLANLVDRAKRYAALHGYDPEHGVNHPTGPAHVSKGTSTLYDADGQQVMQWVKTSLKHDQMLQLMQEVVDELKTDIRPAKPVKLASKSHIDELLNLYALTDVHFGMRAWGEETGDDWDLGIAERTVLAAFGHLIASAPAAHTGFLLQLGDALHYDGLLPITPTSGHVLDADSRFPKVVRTVIRVFRQCINMLLAKYKKVVVLHAQGNHDPASSVWLQEWFSVLYEDEPRVEIVVSPKPYYAYVHGRVLIGAHHGHKKVALPALVQFFNDEFRHLLGVTDRTCIHTGHLHTDDLYVVGRTRAERHETIAARDAHASGGGFPSDRSMKRVTYGHHAELSREIFHPSIMELVS